MQMTGHSFSVKSNVYKSSKSITRKFKRWSSLCWSEAPTESWPSRMSAMTTGCLTDVFQESSRCHNIDPLSELGQPICWPKNLKFWPYFDLSISCVCNWYCCDRKSPSGMCAKLRTVAASNNRVHAPRSLYYCLFAPRIYIVVVRAHPVRGESHI